MKNSINITLRPASEPDMQFIYDSWMRSYRKAGINCLIPDDYYKSWQSRKIEEIFGSGSTIMVASEAEDTDNMYGWLCYSTYETEPVCHFVYVKSKYRKNGLCKMMMKKAGFTENIMTTCVTYITNTRKNNKTLKERYNIMYLPDLASSLLK